MAAGSDANYSIYHPDPSLFPRTAEEAGLHPFQRAGTGSWTLALDQPSTGHCSHFESKPKVKRSPYNSAFLKN